MNKDIEAIKDDVAFLRALAGDSHTSLRREGFVLLAVGAIFAPVDFFYWLHASRIINVSGFLEHLPWIAGALLLFVVIFVINAKIAKAPSAAGRAINAASMGVGWGILAAVTGLGIGAARMNMPLLVISALPVLILTLYGAVWTVAYAVKRRAWFAFVAVGCLLTAIACGFVMGSPAQWLLLSAAMILLVALPGALMTRQRDS